MLDERFRGFLIHKMGHEVYESLSHTSKNLALKHWQDIIKPSYTGPVATDLLDTGYFIPVPGVPDLPKANIHGGFLYMEACVSQSPNHLTEMDADCRSSKDVKAVFDPIIGEIEKLVGDQIHKAEKLDFSPKVYMPSSYLRIIYSSIRLSYWSVDLVRPSICSNDSKLDLQAFK